MPRQTRDNISISTDEPALRRMVAREPGDAEALRRLGIIVSRRDPTEAASLLRRALALRPDDPTLHNDLGVALEAAGEQEAAVQCYRQALSLRPDFYQVRSNLATALLKLGRPDDCEREAMEALAAEARGGQPRYASAHYSLGAARLGQGRHREACESLRETIRLDPNHVEAHASLGTALLALGEFEAGWREYEWRRKHRQFTRPGKPWDGSDPFGQTILLWGEGGLGDSIQFARYASVLADMGARVILECDSRLKALLKDVRGIWRIVGRDEAPPSYDLQCPLVSVAAILGSNLQTIPATTPYIRADQTREANWREKLASLPGMRIGVSWQGEQRLVSRRNRSFAPGELAPLSRIEGVRLISLQKGWSGDVPSWINALPGMDEGGEAFLDAAAVMRCVDLVITCDTSIAHVAGALGARVWVALPFAADWRWLTEREDSPWYPTMRLFRQSRQGEWADVFDRMADALRERIAAASPAPAVAADI